MILQFSTVFPEGKGMLSGMKTGFVERIILGLVYFNKCTPSAASELLKIPITDVFRLISKSACKIHTIRKDEKNRWIPDVDIHFQIWSGRPYHSRGIRFAPIIKVKSVQRIDIVKVARVSTPFTCMTSKGTFQVMVNGRCLEKKEIKLLVRNDGFNNEEEFFNWFDTDFSGKIIHWTEYKY